MKQLLQNYKSGEMSVKEIPEPVIMPGNVLVQNHFSLISSGTEKNTVKTAQSSLAGKAKQRPDLVKQVLNQVKKNGLKETIELVKNRLDSYVALGYSSAGTVLASLDTKSEFKPGDRVACAGQNYASHAQVVSVPQNLTVKVPDNVTFEEAGFTTLGAIALQGVRQANPKLGDNICVIGLGLLGQLTVQLLKANGCNVLGVDVSDANFTIAIKNGIDDAVLRSDNKFFKRLDSFTSGNGFDSVIVTAATSSNDPVEVSAEILRKKGVVVIVGAVKMDIPRDPHFYKKELELKMSSSYGPGRYDVHYEEEGTDYPYGYVRWTEKRNMEAFLQLISNGKINVKSLITHTFDIEDALTAYDIVLGKKEEKHLAILLRYNKIISGGAEDYKLNDVPVKEINTGFIGAGNFAQSFLIPNVIKAGASLDTVVTSKGSTALNCADKFKFGKYSTSPADVTEQEKINTVFIASRHDTHAGFVIDALKKKKNVFVEKPVALSLDELNRIKEVYKISEGARLMVGFNRRFAPLAEKFKGMIGKRSEPLHLNFRINAGYIPKDNWIQKDETGGGRIIGEVCHFIDLMQYFTDSDPVKVYASCIGSSNAGIKNDDNISVNIEFEDKSIGSLVYTALGDKSLPKEYMEIFYGGDVYIIDDFKEGRWHHSGEVKKYKEKGKGHKEEIEAFFHSIKSGSESPISFNSIYLTTLTTFKIKGSLSTGLPQLIKED